MTIMVHSGFDVLVLSEFFSLEQKKLSLATSGKKGLY
jgi:hypothetical protein